MALLGYGLEDLLLGSGGRAEQVGGCGVWGIVECLHIDDHIRLDRSFIFAAAEQACSVLCGITICRVLN